MNERDQAEAIIRAWDAYETSHGRPAVIDFDCHPRDEETEPAPDRLTVYRQLTQQHAHASGPVAARLDADLAYLEALLGARPPFVDYIARTQGCGAAGWPEDYVAHRGNLA